MANETQQIFFSEPRLNFTAGGEFLIRLVTYSVYVILTSVTILLFFSGISSLRSVAILFFVFLLDRLLHYGQAERGLSEIKGGKINIAPALSPASYKVLSYAFRKAMVTEEDFYLLILKGLLERDDIKEGLRRLDVKSKDFLDRLEHLLSETPKRKMTRSEILNIVESVAVTSYGNALNTYEQFIEPRNLFVAVSAASDPSIAKLFDFFDVSTLDLQEAIIFGRWRKMFAGINRLPAVLSGFIHRPRFVRHRVMNRAWTARPTPTLDEFSTDLTDLARAEKIGLLVGHEKEFAHMLDAISRAGKPNALLVGEPGVGKSTIIAHLAFRMVKDQVPAVLFDKRLVSLEVAELVANATPEALAGRLEKIAEEILLAGNIVLVIPDLHNLFRTTQAKSLNAIDLLMPVIKSENIPIIGETYPREFKQYIEQRSDFLEQFEMITIDEISEAEALRFLVYSSLILEKQSKVFITFRSLKKSVEFAHRYFRAKILPGSAIDLLKQALAKAEQGKFKVLDENLVAEVAERQSKIPIQRVGLEETDKLLNLESLIHKRLVDQEAAVKAVARALREYRSGLSRAGGPIATFLFVGPTGVGKTELAKLLAQVQFGSKEAMRRFDMSEYQDKQSIFRLIGTPDGERTGALTDAVLEAPYSLVLLDEFEKANPDILNIFLQVFDDGRLTDSLHRTVDFQNTIIIATSNAHSEFIKEEIEAGKGNAEIAETLKKKLTDYFKPELINRFSEIIVFKNLSLEEVNKIAGFLVEEVAETLRQSQGIDLKINASAVQKISELGYSPVFGARPLRQVISEKVRGVLAEKILRKEVSRGDTIELFFENGDFNFKIKQ